VLLAELIAEGLGQHLKVLCVATVAEGVELLMSAAVDVVLLDSSCPGKGRGRSCLRPTGRTCRLSS
jgi:DNA-binding response OmpR family regulator